MIHSKKRQEGIKLIELLLVMAIAAGILFYSFRQYLSYRSDADAYQLRYNVDLIFQAMAQYFRANCGKTGHVLNADYPDGSFAVTMTDLKDGGYLTTKLAFNPLVTQTTPEQGYVMQFNQKRPLPAREQEFYANPPIVPGTVSKATIGQIILWNAQVSVLLKNASTAKQYQRLLQANCLSTLGSAGGSAIVYPCTGGPSPNGARYAVWMRLPSLSSSQSNSTYWTTMPVVKEFTQRYTTYPVIMIDDKAMFSDQQFFVCGT